MAASAQIAEVNHRHEAIADIMLSFPDLKKGEIAEMLGYTQAWLSSVINSDAFIFYYDNRRLEYNAALHQETVNKLYEVAIKATEKVSDLLDAEDIDPRFVLDAKDKALHRLGYGPSRPAAGESVGVQNNIYVASPDGLMQARERMNEFHQKKSEVIDGEVLSSRESNSSGDSEDSASVLPQKATSDIGETQRNKV